MKPPLKDGKIYDGRKLYKRANKKYYARLMKENMTEEEFKARGEQAAARRDTARLHLEGTKDPKKQSRIVEELNKELSRL